MCGIVGVASRQDPIDANTMIRMRDTLHHRGPDDVGVWQSPDRYAILAHTRLSIIDLSAAGHQPMVDTEKRISITYNGEIYNYPELRRRLESNGYSFRTATDTEVILTAYHAWQIDCLSRLNGMFAFGLYDGNTRRLFLARDRAGEKPLYYRHTPGRLVFASELKALMSDPGFPRRLDLEALQFYLAYGYVPGEMCILQGVRKLGQGQALVYNVEADHLCVWRYWQLPAPKTQAKAPEEELTEELESLLRDSVRRQLTADVPVGVLLSGGIDSSLITAMAAGVSPRRIKTFTVSFPGHGSYDESPQARIVAKHFDTDHTELVAEPATVRLLPDLARQYDEPIADSSMIPMYFVSRLIRPHATVALGGDGGDELFGGYPYYSRILRQERARQYLPAVVRRRTGEAAAQILPAGFRGRNYLIGFTSELAYSIAHANICFDENTRRRLLSPLCGKDYGAAARPEDYIAALCEQTYSAVRQATEADFRTTLVDAYLVKVDRASMLTSLEVRAPWLDYRIVEFAFGRVPDHLRATSTQRKILSRRMAQRILPSELDLNRKQGFSMPLAAWFKGEWGSYMETVLRDADPRLFDQRLIRKLIAGQRCGFTNTSRLFCLTFFELWRREYHVSLPE